ncbi:hypothetical protein BH23CHL4_BH23CHL4_00040 [soil metagenome]
MTSRSSRIVFLGVALLVMLLSLSGLAVAQNDVSDPGPATSRSQETVVLSDTFDDPEAGIIPVFAGASENLTAEYDAGFYDIDALAADFTGPMVIPFGDVYTAVSVAVAVLLTGGIQEAPGRYIFLTCRVGENGGGYRLEFRPQIGAVVIRKLDSGAGEQIASAKINEGDPITGPARLELRCNGATITGRVSGQDVVSIQDTAFTSGGLELGGGVYTISSGRVSVNFNNLAVSVPNALAPTQVAATPVPEPVVDRSAIMAPVEQLRAQATAKPPIYGPEAGAITQVVGGSLDAQYSGVSVADFVARVTFRNPEDPATPRWDFGIGFRQDESSRHWRIIVRSDGAWSLAIAAEFPRATGVIESFNLEPGGTNSIELVVSGAVGYLLVNDAFTAMLDLSAWQEAGDIWVGSGLFLDFATQGAVTTYEDFSIWAIGEAASGEPAEELTPVPEETPAQEASVAVEATTVDVSPLAEEATAVEESPVTAEEPLPEAAPAATTPPDEPSRPVSVSPVAESPISEIVSTPEAAGSPVPASPEALAPDDGAALLDELRGRLEPEEPDFGPSSGIVTQGVGSIDIESATVSVEDFYTTVRFSNPASADAPDHTWDVLIGFWHSGGDDQIRLVVSSDGAWSAAQGTARPIVTGSASSVLLGPARGNVIELAVVDDIGYLAINGEFEASFEVPGSPQPGDIWIASGTFPENVQPGVDTPFSDWSVWSLD